MIVGAGIFGLWAARHAIKAGKRVHVYEKRKLGEGASGGFLGALMPHMPDTWNVKKQMQYEALVSLPDSIDALEKDTGVDCGYRKCGRLLPLAHSGLVPIADARAAGAVRNWSDAKWEPKPVMEWIRPKGDGILSPDWLSPTLCPHGATWDTLSARVNPRAYLQALNHFVASHAQVSEETEVCDIQPNANRVRLSDGSAVHPGHILIASGYEAYPMLQAILGPLNGDRKIGRGVKGQAVLLEHPHDDTQPIVYHDGVYVVPHAGNRVAVGSTSVGDWSGPPHQFDPDQMAFYHKALEWVPSLADAPIIERWAGVRPRNMLADPWSLSSGTEPYVGSVPGYANLSVAIGGFKISLGIAHWLTGKLECCR